MTQRRPLALKVWYYAVAALLVALAVGPALWLANVAMQPTSVAVNGVEVSYGVSEITNPRDYTLANFAGAMNVASDASRDGPSRWQRAWESGLLRPLMNSVIVTVLQCVLNVLLAALCAYPLARMTFRGRDLLFALILATLMVPEQVIVVPLFVTVVDMGLYDTLAAVIIPGAVSAFGVFLCRQAFLTIPLEMEEAARIDGAGALRIWWHVMLPLSRPTLATLAVFSMIGAWSNLLWPLIVLQDDRHQTLPVAIDQLLSVFGDNVRLAYAASVMALVPMVLVYIVMQKWLQRGLLSGAVKG